MDSEESSHSSLALPRLPARGVDAHKGTFGTVAVVGGCAGANAVMIGAPALTAEAALRAGAGLVRLVMPAPVLASGLVLCPSATGIPLRVVGEDEALDLDRSGACATVDRVSADAACIAVGPGLGDSPGSRALVLRAIQQDHVYLVLDADGLNALGGIAGFMEDFKAPAVITPHPGEFRRIVAALGLKGDLGLSESRELAASRLAQRMGCVVVLKGAGTVVSDGMRTWTNTTGHPCMATAGTGDVLTGVIAGVIAQFCPTVQQMLFKAKVPLMPSPGGTGRPLDVFDAARVGVHVHGLAGELWSAERGASAGMLASELAGLVPAAMERVRGSG